MNEITIKILAFYLLAVAIGESVGHLVDVLGRDALLEPALRLLLEVLVKLALGRELEDEVDAALVIEISEKTENVWVTEVGLNLYFSPEKIFPNYSIKVYSNMLNAEQYLIYLS